MSQRAQASSISVFLPAYNDAGTIGMLVTASLEVLAAATADYEVVVIDDGSTDGTGDLLDALAGREPYLKVVRHEQNRGYGAVLRSGFGHSTKDLIFYTDGDGQYDPRELPRLLDLMDDEVDIVNGYKRSRSDDRVRLVIGNLYNLAARLFFRIPISDVDCDFRLIRRCALEKIELHSTSGAICIELVRKLHWAGCRFVETPVHHYARSHGSSQFFTLRSVTKTTIDFIFLWLKLVPTQWFRAKQGARTRQPRVPLLRRAR